MDMPQPAPKEKNSWGHLHPLSPKRERLAQPGGLRAADCGGVVGSDRQGLDIAQCDMVLGTVLEREWEVDNHNSLLTRKDN